MTSARFTFHSAECWRRFYLRRPIEAGNPWLSRVSSSICPFQFRRIGNAGTETRPWCPQYASFFPFQHETREVDCVTPNAHGNCVDIDQEFKAYLATRNRGNYIKPMASDLLSGDGGFIL